MYCLFSVPHHTSMSLSGGGCTSLVLVSFPLNYWTKEFGKKYSYRKFSIIRIYRPPKLYERIEVRHNHPATPDQRHDVSRSTDTDRIRWSPCCWISCSHQNPDYAQPQVGNLSRMWISPKWKRLLAWWVNMESCISPNIGRHYMPHDHHNAILGLLCMGSDIVGLPPFSLG